MTPDNPDAERAEQVSRILTVLRERAEDLTGELRALLSLDQKSLQDALDRIAREESEEGERRLTRMPADVVFRERGQENRGEKRRIGQAAANLIEEGATVFLASGSTVYEVAKRLVARELTVVTNSLPVINLLADRANIELISVGGALRRSEMSFIGRLAESSLGQYPIDRAVLGVYAINVAEGLTHKFVPETMTDRAILETGEKVMVVADHTKFGRQAPTFVAPLSKIDVLVTGREARSDDVRTMQAAGIHVVQA